MSSAWAVVAGLLLMVWPSAPAPAAHADCQDRGWNFASMHEERGVVRGYVLDASTTEPLVGANVRLRDINAGAATDDDGRFVLRVRPRTYHVVVSMIGYETTEDTVVVRSGGEVARTYRMRPTSFKLGGIEVVADDAFIPLDPETKTVITAGEIEHVQASSLGGVLQLLPGAATTNPTLETPGRATLRGGDALGTQVVLDGVPLSNAANMQVGIGYSTANSGIDLRSIPAENIEEVEIVRGIPSAKYGDLADGAVLVRTRQAPQPLRTKAKYNPQVYEANVSGGTRLSERWTAHANGNVARSQRDVRIEGDGYTRIAAQLSVAHDAPRTKLRQRIYYTRAFDERKELPGYALRTAWYNRDQTWRANTDFSWRFSTTGRVEAAGAVSYVRQHSYDQQLVSRDNMVVTDREGEGTQEGTLVFGSYLGQQWVRGEAFNLFGELSVEERFALGRFIHGLSAGVSVQSDFNEGEGIVFDPLYPPSLSNPTPRLRSYDALPSMEQVSLYLEDRVTGRLIVPFTLQAGFRYELYRPYALGRLGGALVRTHSGAFFNPRLNLALSLHPTTQLRLGYGKTSKAPPMGMLFAQDWYYDVVDTVSVVDPQDAAQNFALVSTYVRERANASLKAYTQRSYEVSLDQDLGPLGWTLTAFAHRTRGTFATLQEPVALTRRAFPEWPDAQTALPVDTVLATYPAYANSGWRNVRGLELALRSVRLPRLHTVISVDGSYRYTESGTEDGFEFGSPRYSPMLGAQVLPRYHSAERYAHDLLLHYRFDVQARPLGLWLTLSVEHQLVEIDGYRGLADTRAVGYFTDAGETVWLAADQRGAPHFEELRRSVRSYELNEEVRPDRWFVNLRVTKSLWGGAEASFYVNNLLNQRPLYRSQRAAPSFATYERRNIEIYYGVVLSMQL